MFGGVSLTRLLLVLKALCRERKVEEEKRKRILSDWPEREIIWRKCYNNKQTFLQKHTLKFSSINVLLYAMFGLGNWLHDVCVKSPCLSPTTTTSHLLCSTMLYIVIQLQQQGPCLLLLLLLLFRLTSVCLHLLCRLIPYILYSEPQAV